MPEESLKDWLTAILSTNARGYGRLMREDEDATIPTLTAYRGLVATLIDQYQSRVVDSPGDDILAEIASVVDPHRAGRGRGEPTSRRFIDLKRYVG